MKMFVVGLNRFCFAAKDAEMWYVNFCCWGAAAAVVSGAAEGVVVVVVAVLALNVGAAAPNLGLPIVENGLMGVGEITNGFARDGDI